MARASYESELGEIWRRAVDPAGVGMPEAIASEIASYTQEPVNVVLDRMSRGKDDFARLWRESNIDPSDSAQVAAFYRDQQVELYELAEWHSGRLNGVPPLNYAHAAFLARSKGLRRALDFGSGIGTGALCLSGAGCTVDCADISNTLLAFVGDRFKQRGLPVTLFDLATGRRPPANGYDLITCFDVLEHVPDQRRQLCELESNLRPGGHLVVNLMNDSSHPDRPMHVSSAGDWLAMVRTTSLIPDWSSFRYADDVAQVMVRNRWGRARNLVGRWVDRYQHYKGARAS